MKLHSLTACYTPPDAEEIECTIYFTFTPGEPERGPTYACGGTPEEPAEVEFYSVSPSGREGWAINYLAEHHDEACEQAAHDLEPDPDAAYERMRDERMERRNYE